jgi:hypothetical protein
VLRSLGCIATTPTPLRRRTSGGTGRSRRISSSWRPRAPCRPTWAAFWHNGRWVGCSTVHAARQQHRLSRQTSTAHPPPALPQAAGEDAQEQRHARFKAVMARHQDRIQVRCVPAVARAAANALGDGTSRAR